MPYAAEQADAQETTAFDSIDIRELGKAQPARWLGQDPKAYKYPRWSPYNYCMNSPLLVTDPNGEEVYVFIWEKDKDGTTHYRKLKYQDSKLYYNYGNGNYSPMKSTAYFDSKGSPLFSNDANKRISLMRKGL